MTNTGSFFENFPSVGWIAFVLLGACIGGFAIIISKHRNGSIGTVKLNFEKERTKFSSLSAVFETDNVI